MLETQSQSAFEFSAEITATSESRALPPLPALLGEVVPPSHPLIWKPLEPQFTKAIADYYGVSRKTVQEWFQKIKDACPWIAASDLKLLDDRYTPTAVSLMGSYRTSGLPFKAWKAQIWQETPDLVAAFQASLLPQSFDAPTTSDRPSGNGNIVCYERSAAMNSLLESRPQLNPITLPDQNPLILALQSKVAAMTHRSLDMQQKLDQARQIAIDTHQAIQALEDLQVVESARIKADRHYQLEKQAYARRLEDLGVQDLGKIPAETIQPRSA